MDRLVRDFAQSFQERVHDAEHVGRAGHRSPARQAAGPARRRGRRVLADEPVGEQHGNRRCAVERATPRSAAPH